MVYDSFTSIAMVFNSFSLELIERNNQEHSIATKSIASDTKKALFILAITAEREIIECLGFQLTLR
jgi:hypothetical protein